MKNPPTLADQCVALMLDKRRMANGDPGNAEMLALFRLIPLARKFVLDRAMSRYLADLSRMTLRGGLRKRIRQVENMRQMARLPHALTWIEFDYPAFLERNVEYGIEIIRPPGVEGEPFPARLGWLFQQHEKIETAIRSTEFFSSLVLPGTGMSHPTSIVWCVDDTPLPWRKIRLWQNEKDESTLCMLKGYQSTQVGWTFTFSEGFSAPMMKLMGRWAIKPTMPCRDVWTLLATLNDLPVIIERVQPSKGYISRGSYKKFLAHSVIHLTVPETRWYKIAQKAAALIRRRAHQVRGHWRVDYRARPISTCDHIWNAEMVCTKCGGHKLWIAEHQRGDASLGFVTHDYDVTAKI